VRLFRDRGLVPGDALALVCSNRVEFVEVLAATLRCGLRLTPVNWHLSADEIAYIIRDCEAKALIGEARVATLPQAASACEGPLLKLAIGGRSRGSNPTSRPSPRSTEPTSQIPCSATA
jgi:long-chain acyl-CoA synthetase